LNEHGRPVKALGKGALQFPFERRRAEKAHAR
jgi:hypothetical protein